MSAVRETPEGTAGGRGRTPFGLDGLRVLVTLALCLLAWALGAEVLRVGTRVPVRTRQIRGTGGNLYRISLALPLPQGRERLSTLVVLEDGRRLGPARASVKEIRKLGKGRYRHTRNAILFATGDNSDPRRNGRRYELWLDPTPHRRAIVGLLLLAGAINLPALVRGLRSAPGRPAAGPAWLLWFLVAAAVLVLHQAGLLGSARAGLWTAVVAASAAALAAERAGARGRMARLAGRLPAALTWAALLFGGFAALRFLAFIRPMVGGVDFYCYLCDARDLAAGLPRPALERLLYFPGVYAFWRAAMAVFGSALPGLQWAAVLLVAGNAVLVGLLLRRAGLKWAVGGAAALWYLALASRLEGFHGVTEPLCTIFFLAGLVLWGGDLTGGRRSNLGLAALGIGLGLALYSKQQGGLLSLGWLVLPVAALGSPPPRWPTVRRTLVVPLAAFLAAGAAFALGGGFDYLRGGLGYALAYPTVGEPLENLRVLLREAGPALAAGFACCLGVVTFAALSPRHRGRLREPRILLLAFCTLSGAFGLAQFLRRALPHYALISLPALVAAVAILASDAWSRLDEATGRRPALRILAAGFVALLLVRQPTPGAFQAWPLPAPDLAGRGRPWHQRPAIARDLEAVARHVARGEAVLLLPVRRDEVHFLLGTRSASPAGYGWPTDPGLWVKAIDSGSVSTVLAIEKTALDGTDVRFWADNRLDDVVARLPARGFRKEVVLPTMTLWRRG